jgi:hypothetical protein
MTCLEQRVSNTPSLWARTPGDAIRLRRRTSTRSGPTCLTADRRRESSAEGQVHDLIVPFLRLRCGPNQKQRPVNLTDRAPLWNDENART